MPSSDSPIFLLEPLCSDARCSACDGIGGSHGLWQRDPFVAARHPNPNHYSARAVLASLMVSACQKRLSISVNCVGVFRRIARLRLDVMFAAEPVTRPFVQ